MTYRARLLATSAIRALAFNMPVRREPEPVNHQQAIERAMLAPYLPPDFDFGADQ